MAQMLLPAPAAAAATATATAELPQQRQLKALLTAFAFGDLLASPHRPFTYRY